MKQKIILIKPLQNGCILNNSIVKEGIVRNSVSLYIKEEIENFFGTEYYPIGSKEDLKITITFEKGSDASN